MSPTWVLIIVFSAIFIMMQRADPTAKRVVNISGWSMILIVLVWIWWNSWWQPALVAIGVSLLISGLFWVLIGRYNPVSSSDDIRVLGMDD